MCIREVDNYSRQLPLKNAVTGIPVNSPIAMATLTRAVLLLAASSSAIPMPLTESAEPIERKIGSANVTALGHRGVVISCPR
jgi:hypothetical protein